MVEEGADQLVGATSLPPESELFQSINSLMGRPETAYDGVTQNFAINYVDNIG